MKIRNLIVATPLSFIFMACDSGWTASQEAEYKNNCIELGKIGIELGKITEQCNCAFDKFSIEYSYSEYSPLGAPVNRELSDTEIDKAIEINKEIRKCFE